MYGFVNDFNDKISVIITLNFSNKYIMLPNIIKKYDKKRPLSRLFCDFSVKLYTFTYQLKMIYVKKINKKKTL